jgi:hypothetical protein
MNGILKSDFIRNNIIIKVVVNPNCELTVFTSWFFIIISPGELEKNNNVRTGSAAMVTAKIQMIIPIQITTGISVLVFLALGNIFR